jgi:glycosyltransferase involved in cell wall biosynthesis
MNNEKKSIIVMGGGPIGDRMAGPAIRSLEMATSLSKCFDILLVTPNKSPFAHLDFDMVWEKDPKFKEALRTCDGILTQGIADSPFRIALTKKPILIDLYIPYWFEPMEMEGKGLPLNKYLLERRLHFLLKLGDFFICASEKQRDLWLGSLAAVGRLTSPLYKEDRVGKTLIAIVPFGIPETPPVKKREVIKGNLIQPTDKLILWNGGLWKWLDPFTLIKAMAAIRKHREDIKLLFLGTHHPNRGPVQVETFDEAVQLAKLLGIYSKNVLFNDTWIPYEERQDYLLEADVAVSLHGRSLESLFSFRTRLLDCIWAAVPIVCTEGDFFADLVEREGLGIVVKPGDVEEVKEGIIRILEDQDFNEKCKKNLSRVSSSFVWSKCTKPVEIFFTKPPRKTRRFFPNLFILFNYLTRIAWGNLIYRLGFIHDTD